jgi:ABC-type branched-subunit amino acid transport system substrate-binding protein
MNSRSLFAVAGAAACLTAVSAAAQDYKIGVSAAITGPVASTYAPAYEGLKIYLDALNEKGGINGHKVNAIYLNNQAAPPRAVADSKRLVDEEKVLAMINIATSATYEPMIADARRTKTPLLFLGSAVCPANVYPPKPDPYLFCSSFNMVNEDGKAMVQFLKELSGQQKPKLGLLAMDIPISRQGVDMIEKAATASGFQVVGKVAAPMTTADFTPFATRFKEAGADWIAHWAPFTVGVAMFTSLQKLGWSGNYLAVASPTAEADTVQFAQPNFFVMPSYSFTVDNLPVFKDIEAAAKKYQATYATDALSLGWVAGMVVEAGLKACGWPCDSEKLRKSLETIKVDTKGLYGGPIDWSATNHLRSKAHYKLYRWDSQQKKIVRVKDWVEVAVQ